MSGRIFFYCILVTAGLLGVPRTCRAVDEIDETDAVETEAGRDLRINPTGYGALEIGQIHRGYYKPHKSNLNTLIRNVWQQRALADIGFLATYKEFLTMEMIGEGMIAFSTPQVGLYPTTTQARHFFTIKSANALISFGNPSRVGGEVQAGYFPYKYNRDARNLGEYMFRSNPYPLVIYADFDYPQANLLGFRFNIRLFDKLVSNDLLIHSEMLALPVQNWSITDIVEANLFRCLSLGAGLSLHHFLNVYQGSYVANWLDRYHYPQNLPAEEKHGYTDTVLDHRAVKMMGRIAFDPKRFFPEFLAGYFNENDLRAYGEIDIIGRKNYPVHYEKLSDRTLYSFGFNLPGFFVLDLLNLEFEYCENRTAFSDELFYGDSYPVLEPVMPPALYDIGHIKRVLWRWSLYMKKSFFDDHFSLIGQFARDHKKINFYYFEKEYMSFREALPTSKDWWWTFKTEFRF